MLVVSLVLAALLLLLLTIRRKANPVAGVPYLSGPSVARQFSKNPATFLSEAHKKYGNVFTVDLYMLRMTVSFNKEDVNKFFKAPETEMTIKSTKRFTQAVIGPEAFMTEVSRPDTHKYITEGFVRNERLQYYVDTVRQETNKQIARLAGLESFDLFPEISRIVVLCNTLCFLGEDTYKQYGEEFATCYYNIEMNAFKPLSLLAPWLPTAANKLVKRSRQRLIDIVKEEANKRLANKEKYRRNMDFLQFCINMAQEEGFPEENYARWFSSLFVSLMFAAHTNTAGTFAWSVAHIADNKEFQEKARQECEEALKEGFNLNTLSKLSFLDCVMKETVRSYALLFLTRRTITPQEFGGATVPEGEIVAISPYLTHHDPSVYEDPETFNPERFRGGASTKHFEDKTYMQFGFGPHRCLGEKFANVVLKTGWLDLLSNYRIELLSPLTPPDFSRAIGMPFCQGSIRAKIVK
jgi:sterol 14-demethylase